MFKDISNLELWWPFIQQSRTICVILVEGIMRCYSVNFFEFGPVVQEKMLFKDISYQELLWPFCLEERNQLFNFGRRDHEKKFFEITLNLDLWFRRCRLEKFSSRALAALFQRRRTVVQFW